MRNSWLVGIILGTALVAVPAAQGDTLPFHFTLTGVATGATTGVSGANGVAGGSGNLIGTLISGSSYNITGGSDISITVDSITYSGLTVITNPTLGTLDTADNPGFNYDDILNLADPNFVGGGILFLIPGSGTYKYLELWYASGGDVVAVSDASGANYDPANSPSGYDVTVNAVITPEPSSMLLLGSGLLCMAGFLFWKAKPVLVRGI
jgi:hypothetical protein